MTEKQLEEFIIEAIGAQVAAVNDEPQDCKEEIAQGIDLIECTTFEDDGVLTRDRGFTVRIEDQEFQVTIKRSH